MGFVSDIKEDVRMNRFSNTASIGGFIKLLLFHAGFQLLFLFRIQKALQKLPLIGGLLSRLVWIISVWITSCHISRISTLEGGIRLPHATGIVIGERVTIKKGVTIYQHVTIGLKETSQGNPPVIEEGATLYTGAVIVGEVTIGKNAQVGANAVVTKDVPDASIAVGVPAINKEPKPA